MGSQLCFRFPPTLSLKAAKKNIHSILTWPVNLLLFFSAVRKERKKRAPVAVGTSVAVLWITSEHLASCTRDYTWTSCQLYQELHLNILPAVPRITSEHLASCTRDYIWTSCQLYQGLHLNILPAVPRITSEHLASCTRDYIGKSCQLYQGLHLNILPAVSSGQLDSYVDLCLNVFASVSRTMSKYLCWLHQGLCSNFFAGCVWHYVLPKTICLSFNLTTILSFFSIH